MSTNSAHRLELREARFDDYEGIAALENSQELASKPFDEWRRMWTANPCYQNLDSRWPIGWVLVDDQRVVGCLCNIPLPYVFQGRQLLVAAGRGWAVEEQYRGYSLLLMDAYFSQENVDVFLNNTVNGKAAEAFSTFGSLRVPSGDWSAAAFAVLRHRSFAESALRIKNIPQHRLLSYPAGLALSVKDKFTTKRIPKLDIDVSFAEKFDSRFDLFWERLRDQSKNFLAVRSSDVLNWHFGAPLEEERIWIMTAAREGHMAAYSIFQRRDEPQYGLKRMRMIDFQASGDHDRYCAALMLRALDECRARDIHVLEQIGCELHNTRVFETAAPYRRKLPSWSFFYSAKNEELAGHLSRTQAWAPSAYDGDASL